MSCCVWVMDIFRFIESIIIVFTRPSEVITIFIKQIVVTNIHKHSSLRVLFGYKPLLQRVRLHI